jgi:formylglycine-generating enzyme required for sulfatase activity
MPPTRLNLDADAAHARLERLFGGRPNRPSREQPFTVKTTNMPMVWIEPGEFLMGSDQDQKDGRRHRVRLSKGYWMAQYEVAQGQYGSLMNGNPSRITGSPSLPVDWVAWDQAVSFCRRLNEAEREAGRLPSGYEYRLPTDAEWEYACRAGSDEEFSVPTQMIWSRTRGEWRPHEVAESPPNPWGLYDMHGNAPEICLDAWYEYPRGSKDVAVDPVTLGRSERGASIVLRGGAWWFDDGLCASGRRDRCPATPDGFRGFRVVLGPEIRTQTGHGE